MEGRIINITRFCTDDGPGIRTTVFLKGCPLRCVWCHNPESQNPAEERYSNGETVGRTVSVQEVLTEVLRDKPFYETSDGGVTISGGEPLFQPEFTAELLRLCQEHGIHTAVETAGFATRSVLESVVRHCDLVLFDIKETDAEKHREYTGAPLAVILENLAAINAQQVPFVIRLPIVPSYNDRADHFQTVKALADGLPFCQGVQVMPYHKLGEYKYRQLGREYPCGDLSEPSKQQAEQWQKFFEKGG